MTSARLPIWGIPCDAYLSVTMGERDLTSEESAHLTTLYDGVLTYLDSQLGRLLDRLREHPAGLRCW